MVLESIFSAGSVEKNPIDMLILSIIVTLICVYVSYMIFPEYSGVITPLLITIAMTPLLFKIFKIEEEIDREVAEKKMEKTFIDRHDETIKIFTFFFIGVFLSILLVAVVMPTTFVDTVFKQQINTIQSIAPSGAVLMEGYTMEKALLNTIITNNLKVMFFSFLLSFLIGTGALFILAWNASILSLYFANFIRQGLYNDFLYKMAGIAPHAPVEIAAYFLAGIAGGILSVGVIRERLGSKEFMIVFKDSLLMMIFAVLAVLFGGLLEVFI